MLSPSKTGVPSSSVADLMIQIPVPLSRFGDLVVKTAPDCKQN